MSQSAGTLALRFLLEIAALVGVDYWGWTQHSGVACWGWTIGLPFWAALLWGTFRTGEGAPWRYRQRREGATLLWHWV